jgi:hypothetical protein
LIAGVNSFAALTLEVPGGAPLLDQGRNSFYSKDRFSYSGCLWLSAYFLKNTDFSGGRFYIFAKQLFLMGS